MRNSSAPRLGNWIFVQFMLLLVVIVAPLFVVLLLATESGFRGYVYHGDVAKAMAYAPILEQAFQRAGSWKAVEPILSQAPFSYHSVPSAGHAGTSIHRDDPASDWDWIRERIVILDTQRRVVVDSKHLLVGTLHPAEHLAESIVLENQDRRIEGYLLVGTMVDPVLGADHADFLGTMATTLLVLFVVGLALTLPLAYWLGSRLSRPLLSLVEGTRRAASGDWDWGLPNGTPIEIRELQQAFQNLGSHLKESENKKARLLADAAHELRTPLTVVKGTIEAMMDGVFPLKPETLRSVYEEAARMEKIVDSLRLLEDVHQASAQRSEFAWSDLLGTVASLFAAEAQAKGIELTLRVAAAPIGYGSTDAVHQIVVNLVSNALRHTPQAGSVIVEVMVRDDGQLLSVDDSGPGIPPADRERIFDRFVRLDASRSGRTGGRGLGLAIVWNLANLQGGSARVVTGLFGGARFEVWLPGAPSRSESDSSEPKRVEEHRN